MPPAETEKSAVLPRLTDWLAGGTKINGDDCTVSAAGAPERKPCATTIRWPTEPRPSTSPP